jgi:hypothetical protein
MTYSMLLLAATTASVPMGAAVMLAFGLGTLPSMVTATVAFERIARALSARATLRNVAGILLLAFGLWTAGNALRHVGQAGHGTGGHDGHAQHAMPAPTQPAMQHEGHTMPPVEPDMQHEDHTMPPAEPAPEQAPPHDHEHMNH